MTTKITVKRFRTRPRDPATARPETATAEMPFAIDENGAMPQMAAPSPQAGTDLDSIRREGLTGRQLRQARKLAQKYNLPATSDFDAVRLLRLKGIDPFSRQNLLASIYGADGRAATPDQQPAPGRDLAPTGQDRRGPPQTLAPAALPSTEIRAEYSHAADVQRIQRELARRRRRRSILATLRLLFFIGLPTFATAVYYFWIATPFYATKSEFVIQQAGGGGAGAGGLGGLLSGTGFATQQDSVAVQGFLQSRDAMIRLDREHGFRAHFEDPAIDPIQRLQPGATLESAYKIYQRNIHVSYDPSEGIVKMEVIAATPEKAQEFALAMVRYAEELIDQLTRRLREDQMRGASTSYENAEREMLAAQRRVVDLQENFKVLNSEVEVGLITQQIGQLETQLSADRLSLQQMESNASPNRARMDPVKRRIDTLETEIRSLRARLTQQNDGSESIAVIQGELTVAQTDVETRRMLLAQALQALEAARLEASRQVRFLSMSVSPVAPDEATYPRAFEYTMVALLIFAGIYLMISMTVAILREQVAA